MGCKLPQKMKRKHRSTTIIYYRFSGKKKYEKRKERERTKKLGRAEKGKKREIRLAGKEKKKEVKKSFIIFFFLFFFKKPIFSLNFDVHTPSTRDITYLCQLSN